MTFHEIIQGIVDDYLQAWNHKDVNRIVDIFSDNGELNSPLLNNLDPEQIDSKVCGKQKLQHSYARFFNSPSYFTMTKLRVENHDKTVTTYVYGGEKPITLKSTFTLNEYGKLQSLSITRAVD